MFVKCAPHCAHNVLSSYALLPLLLLLLLLLQLLLANFVKLFCQKNSHCVKLGFATTCMNKVRA